MKKFLSGFLAASILFSTVTVFASGGKMIEVIYNVKKVIVNNIDKPFDKDKGPFIYNGTTYLPLRFAADALGVPVTWDGPTGTVIIGDVVGNTNAKYWDQDIKHMKVEGSTIYSYNNPSKVLKDNLNNEYTNYLRLYAKVHQVNQTTNVEFPLNSEISQFKATLAPTADHLSNTAEVEFTIYVDEKEVYKKQIANGIMPEDISINVAGGNKISFRTRCTKTKGMSQSMNLGIGLFNGEFIK